MSGPWSPGPWVVSSTHPTVVYGPDGRGVACMYATERARGNAVLIAAAPDLLEALADLLECFDPAAVAADSRTPEAMRDYAVMQAERAIAKAEGERP